MLRSIVDEDGHHLLGLSGRWGTSVPVAVPDNDRKYVELKARLSPEAHEAWVAFARTYGVSTTAIIEAIGRQMREGRLVLTDGDLDELVKEARAVDNERRDRRG